MAETDESPVGDDFVYVEKETIPPAEKYRNSFYSQMETILVKQVEKCDHYAKVFEKDNNTTMANKFAAYSIDSAKNLDILRLAWKNNDLLPRFTFEHVNLNCLPINIDVSDKELQLVVRTYNLPVEKTDTTYIVADFDFQNQKGVGIFNRMSRRLHYGRISSKEYFNCIGGKDHQLDIVYSTDHVSLTTPEDEYIHYDRPLTFFVDKGRSRTLKRKFKPIKLTFYKRTGAMRCDTKLGTAAVRVDGVNDDSTIVTKVSISGTSRSRLTEACAEVRIKVREPLIDKSIRAHEEKLLVLI